MSAALRRMRRAAARRGQRGIVAMVALMFIIIVAFFAMTQASSISSSNMIDSSRQADSVEALFLAESAIEYAGYKFVAAGGTTCDDATVGVGAGDIALGRGNFRVLGAFYSNFDGTAFATGTKQCRVRVQGEITASRVTRTLESVVSTEEDVISISALNPNFNNVPYDGTRVNDNSNSPTNWSLTGGTQGMQYIGWDHRGGNSSDNTSCTSNALDCDRAAFARKSDTGTGAASAGGAFNTSGSPIYITAPKTLRLTFDFRVWTRGSSSQEMQFSPRLQFSHGTFNARTTETGGGECNSGGSSGWCESGCTVDYNGDGDCRDNFEQPAWKGSLGPAGCGYTETPCFESGAADASCPSYDPDSASGYTTYGGTSTGVKAGTNTECVVQEKHVPPSGTSGYKTGYLTYDITGSGQVQLTGITFTRSDGSGALKGKEGQVTWLWVDNLRLSVPGLSGGGPSKLWREVAAP